MIRDITLGQYYPVDSVIHRLDPRTKLFGTLIFIVSLFLADSLIGYGIATVFLFSAIHLSKVPFQIYCERTENHCCTAANQCQL